MVSLPEEQYAVEIRADDRCCVRLLRGDITEYSADAIVNAANSQLARGAGVCGAIHGAGGPTIAAECRQILRQRGPVAPGQAVATTAGSLSARYVIHTVGPVWKGGRSGEKDLLADCYRNCLLIAEELGLHSIAFPAISTGVFGYPIDKAANVAIATLLDSLPRLKSVTLASVVLFDKFALDTFAKVALSLEEAGKSPKISIGVINA